MSGTLSPGLLSVCFISRFVSNDQQMSIVAYPAYEEQGKQTWKVAIRKRKQMHEFRWQGKLHQIILYILKVLSGQRDKIIIYDENMDKGEEGFKKHLEYFSWSFSWSGEIDKQPDIDATRLRSDWKRKGSRQKVKKVRHSFEE